MRKKVYRSKKKQPKLLTEKQVHKALCHYIKVVYPWAIFFSDMSGLRVSMGVATEMKALRSSNAIPDLFVAQPMGEYSGLFIEIKATYADAFKIDGSIRQTEHIIEQAGMLDVLSNLGYYAVFGCGLDECIKIVNEYLDQ